MDIKYIIVQAGGRGSRLGYLTENKPKCLVTVGNRPMLFHLFEKYPDKKFIIIGDYKYDVLEKYLETFAEADFQLVNASGHKGTCSGLAEAAGLVPGNTPFMLIWSDLVLADSYAFPEDNGNMKMVYLKKKFLKNMVLQGISYLWIKQCLTGCQKMVNL